MHIDKIKETVKQALKNKGFASYAPKTGNGDWRIFIAPTSKKITIKCITLNLQESFEKIMKKVNSEIEGSVTFSSDGTNAYFSNQTWEVTERKKRVMNDSKKPWQKSAEDWEKSLEGKTENFSDAENKENLYETSTEKVNEKSADVSLLRLNRLADRYEEILDEYTLGKLALKELLGKIFDGLIKEGMKVYTTVTPVQLIELKIVVPDITKEAFIEAGIKGLENSKKNL
jgi:hypothetical protein